MLRAYWSSYHEEAAEPTIHAVVNGGRRDGEVAGSIQMRFNAREESRKRCQEAEEVAGDATGRGARQAWCTLASARVFFYSEKTRIKSYIPSSILSYLPDPPGAREDTGWERWRGGSLPFQRAVHWNEWPCPPLPPRLFVFSIFLPAPIPSSQSSHFSLSLSPSSCYLIPDPRTYLSSFPFRSPAALLSSLLPRVTPLANLPGLLILRQRTLKAQPKASFE